MAEVQPSSKKKSSGNLDGFLACGGKSPKASSGKPKAAAILTAVDDVNIDALLTAAKNDKLPISRSKSASKAVKSLSQSAHAKPGTERRSSDTRKKTISRAQSFDKNTVMKRLASSGAADGVAGDPELSPPEKNVSTAEKATKSEKPDKGKKVSKSTITRSKSCEAEVMQLARIPRNLARGTPEREREPPNRAKSMNDKQIAKRVDGKRENSSPSAKKDKRDQAPATRKSSSSHDETKDKDPAVATKKSSSNHDEKKDKGPTTANKKPSSNHDKEKDKTKRHSRSSKPESAKKSSKSKSPTPKQVPKQAPRSPTKQSKSNQETKKQALPAEKFEAVATENHFIAPFEATFGEPSRSGDDSDSDAEQFDASGIMQFDPTAADNVVVVRQDSGAFPSCPVEMDLPSSSDLDYNAQQNQQNQQHGRDNLDDRGATTPTSSMWGVKSTFGGMSLFGGRNKLKKSNSFKFGSSGAKDNNATDNHEDTEPPTSLFSTLFSSSNPRAGHEQLGDDETMDGSYLQGAGR